MVEIITFYEQNKNTVCTEKSSDTNVETELLNDETEFSVSQGGADIYHHDVTVVTLYKNLLVVSISFLLIFAAFSSLQNIQSSINIADGLGVIGLTVAYGSKVVSSLFLPPFLMSKLGIKWTLVVSVFGYLAYIAAAFYATMETIIPTSLLLGFGGSNLWTGQMAFATELSQMYSNVRKIEYNSASSRFFGIFFSIYHTGQFVCLELCIL